MRSEFRSQDHTSIAALSGESMYNAAVRCHAGRSKKAARAIAPVGTLLRMRSRNRRGQLRYRHHHHPFTACSATAFTATRIAFRAVLV